MSESFDVIVVGARCAGAPLATMLARDGLRVCLVDKDSFPSDTPSTHGIQPVGVQILERLGVLDSLLKLALPILRLRTRFDDVELPVADVVAIGNRLRRHLRVVGVHPVDPARARRNDPVPIQAGQRRADTRW